MHPDTLATLLKLRSRTVEEARKALRDALGRQDGAEAAVAAATDAIRIETERAAHPDAGDGVVEMFATWLPRARRQVADAQAELEHAVMEAAEARTVLALTRAALEAVESLQRRAREGEALAAARRDQEALDEAGRRPR